MVDVCGLSATINQAARHELDTDSENALPGQAPIHIQRREENDNDNGAGQDRNEMSMDNHDMTTITHE